MLDGVGSGLGRPHTDRRDFDRVGSGADVGAGVGCSFSSLGLGGSEAAASKAEVARDLSTVLTPSRTSSAGAPCGAIVVKVSVGRI